MAVDLKFTPERVKELRERLGLTQLAFAEKVGVSQSTVACWETGQRTPDSAWIVARLLELEREAETATA